MYHVFETGSLKVICWWNSRSLMVPNDSTLILNESEWPPWSFKIHLELFRTFTYICRISGCNSRCNNLIEYTYHVDKKGLLCIGVKYLTVLFDWGMQCNPIKALYIFLSILFVCVQRGINMAESVCYPHLAWADFEIKVKQIAHSIVHFDHWNKLISKM